MKNGKYQHLSLEERERFYALKEKGMSFRQIAKILKRSHSTLSREWKRNAPYFQEYVPCKANRKAQKRALRQRQRAPLKDPLIFLYVREKLRKGWSPEQIAGRLSIDYPEYSIHAETIYRYVYRRENRKEKLWQYLALGRKKRMKKESRRPRRQSKIPDAVSIDQRPQSVAKRKVPGHWETDNMEGKREDKTVVSVTEERISRYARLEKMPNGTAAVKNEAVINSLKNEPARLRLTLTADNGSENTKHKNLTEQLDMPVYFCHPYHSWEKGSVENTIKRVRRFLPKKTTRLDEVSAKKIAAVEDAMNHTPRKCLGFLTPHEKMEELRSSD